MPPKLPGVQEATRLNILGKPIIPCVFKTITAYCEQVG
jgi:hypothetical protein